MDSISLSLSKRVNMGDLDPGKNLWRSTVVVGHRAEEKIEIISLEKDQTSSPISAKHFLN